MQAKLSSFKLSIFLDLFVIKDQRPDLNTLSRLGTVRCAGIRKRGMRRQSSSSVQLILVTFDEIRLVGIDSALVVEFEVVRVFDAERFSVSILVFEGNGNEIVVPVDGAIVGECERMVLDLAIDRTPNVDNLDSFLQELGSFVAGVKSNSFCAGPRGLIDVDSSDRAAGRGVVDLSRDRTSNGMVENNHFIRPRNLLQQVFDLPVVLRLDLFLIHKFRFCRRKLDDLKSVFVKRILIFVAADIIDRDDFGNVSEVALRAVGAVHVIVGFLVRGRRIVKVKLGKNWSRLDEGFGLCLSRRHVQVIRGRVWSEYIRQARLSAGDGGGRPPLYTTLERAD
jgi:hypothetical protein